MLTEKRNKFIESSNSTKNIFFIFISKNLCFYDFFDLAVEGLKFSMTQKNFGKCASWRLYHLGVVPLWGCASWESVSKNLSLERTIFSNFVGGKKLNFFCSLTSLDMGWTNVHSDFENSS